MYFCLLFSSQEGASVPQGAIPSTTLCSLYCVTEKQEEPLDIKSMAQSCESVICFHSSLQTSSALSKINLFLALTSLPRTYCKTDTVCFYVSHFFVSMTLQKWLKYCHENLHSVYSLRGRTFPKFVSQLTQKQAYSDTVELN